MSNYTKTTDFEAKDSLPTGDSGKIIRGAEFETEFDAISTAIATKADTAGPTFTGTLTFDTISDGTIGVTAFVDEDNMASDSATLVPTQQSVKAYVDSVTTELNAQDLDFQADSGGALNIDLDTETMTFTGGTGIDTTGSGNTVTFDIDSTVTTLTGTQTLTNKTLTSPDVNTPDIDGGTIDGTVIGGTTPAAVSATTVSATGNITVGGTVDGRDVATDGAKLDGIEASATADQTDAEIRAAVEAATDSNVFTDADHTKLDGIEANATADQTDAEIRAAVEAATDSNVFTDADHSKLDGIEALADVTDTANVTAAGALMDSELTSEASVKALNQGVATTDTPTFTGLTTTADVSFGDNDKATFNSNLSIFSSGTSSYIEEVGAGDLYLKASNLYITDRENNQFISMVDNGAGGTISLKHLGSTKLATTSTGIDVTGTAVTDGLTVDGTGQITRLGLGVAAHASAGLNITTSGSDQHIRFNNGSELGIIYLDSDGELNIWAHGDGEVINLKTGSGAGTDIVQVDNTGIDVTGTVTADGLTSAGNVLVSQSGANSTITINRTDESPQYNLTMGQSGSSPYITGNDAQDFHINVDPDNTQSGSAFNLNIDGNIALKANAGGDISFYEDTGTTAKLEWDSSEESLTIGGGSTTQQTLRVTGAHASALSTGFDNQVVKVVNTSASKLSGIDFVAANTNGDAGTIARIGGFNTSSASYLGEITLSTRDGTGMVERVRIDDSGNVGIGTSSPSHLLDLRSSTSPILNIQGGDGNSKNIYFRKNTGDTVEGRIKVYDNVMSFETAGSEAMRIDSSGNVGIGTSSPQKSLDVEGNIRAKNTAATSGAEIDIASGATWRFRSNATSGTNSYGLDIVKGSAGTDVKMSIDSSGNLMVGKSSASSGVAGHKFSPTGSQESTVDGGLVAYFNRLSSDGEIVRFDKANAQVGSIGTYDGADIYVGSGDTGIRFASGTDAVIPVSPSSSGAIRGSSIDLGLSSIPFSNLYLSGIIYGVQQTLTRDSAAPLELNRTTNDGELVYFKQAGIVRGSISISGSATSYNTSSDYRLKENVIAMSGATERLKQLAPKRFNFIADADTTVDGFLAHEVADVVPEAITGAKDAVDDDGNAVYQGIDQSKLVPLLVATIQELEARIAALESN